MAVRGHAGGLLVTALVLALGACGGGKDPAVCRREAAELSELLASVDHEPPGFQARDLTLVTRSDTPRTIRDLGPVIHVTREGARYQGEPFRAEEGRERLAEEARRAGRSGGRDLVLYLAVAEDARWADVAGAAVLGWEAGFERQGLVFARPPAQVTPPPRSKIDDELDRILHGEDASNKATAVARLVEQVVKGCPALVREFGRVAAVEGESKADTLIRAIEPALVECRCAVDMPSLRSAMFRLLAVDKPQSAFVITHDPDGTVIDLPADTRWRDAHVRFSPDARVLIKLP